MRRNRTWVAAAAITVLVLLALAVQAGTAAATFPGRNGLIIWTKLFLTTDAELWVMGPNGGQKQSIDHNDQNDSFPAFSADGAWIAFESSTATDMDIWLMRPNGSELHNLTNDPDNADREPAWSPAGDQIALSRQSPFTGLGGIWVVDVDGTNPRRLTESTSVNHHPAWSPDGRWILFSSDRDGNMELYRIRPDGTGERRLTFTPTVHEDNPNWSPDMSKIAYDACDADSFPCPGAANYDIFSISADGTGLTRLTNAPAIDWNPAWSPDGRWIVFRSDRTGFTQIWKMEADGQPQFKLTSEPFEGGVDPDWQPRP